MTENKPRLSLAEKRKLQKEAQSAADTKEWNEFRQGYQGRLLQLIVDYISLGKTGMEVTAQGTFCFHAQYYDNAHFPISIREDSLYDWEFMDEFHATINWVKEERERREAAILRETKRQYLLSKLTAEEKELLGIVK